MKKMTYRELYKQFQDANEKGEELTGCIVFTADSFAKPYPLESRTYKVYSDDRGFTKGKISNAIYGDCLDGTDQGVRLDWYMADWKVDYCYIA